MVCRGAPLGVGRVTVMFSFLELLELLNVWAVVSEMIKVSANGVREFGLVRVRIVLTLAA